MKKSKGFTLIELLAVIVILGILLSISIVAVNKIRKTQETKNKLNTISQIFTGAKSYVSENRIINFDNPDLVNNGERYFQIKIGDLLASNFVDIDKKQYPDLVYADNGTNKEAYRYVSVYQCKNDGKTNGKLEYRYYLGQSIDKTWKYRFTDCGCEEQDKNAKVFLLCEESEDFQNTYSKAGWDSDGKYFKFDNENKVYKYDEKKDFNIN